MAFLREAFNIKRGIK